MTHHYQSWGRFPRAKQIIYPIRWRHETLPDIAESIPKTLLPYGFGRSYGDVCLNDGGTLLSTSTLNHFIHFDPQTGILRCEAGVSLAAILAVCIPQGWFLPTTPGTQFVSIGGAIANDVHGKNHHRAGTFGRHVLQFELLRSDGQRLLCSPISNMSLFRATIAGLGLTGLITWADIQLRRIYHRAMNTETIRFKDLETFFSLSAESDKTHEYTMAWIDCNSQGRQLGRGVFFRGNHVEPDEVPKKWITRSRTITLPFDLPSISLNPWSIRAFNELYYRTQKVGKYRTDYNPFFYPLDAILEWNRLYSKQGFLQYQFVVPHDDHKIIREILQTIASSKLSSFLAVLKTFGDVISPGLLSFPRAGITLALDFPIKGYRTFELLSQLDNKIHTAGGVIYPCKDARMSSYHFQQYFPQWREFVQFIDPHFSSSFWRRVMLQ